ncbi:Rrf2 family transcriptional regulator [Shinella sp.]|uniref:Rrf2 family transcriptional regulator n=1 Tax=Shinella sp. TaxID=1870904 RepID=UPI002589B088|nr:Rrf2 family transcriptional regulator [Shinella sp.]MCW5711995.1 hypothetical protein [Shinella sp.]
MAGFYSARGSIMPPLPWQTFAPPLSGRDGGVALARPESDITLADIHAAVTGEKGLWRPREDIPHRCIVSRHMIEYFGKVDAEAAAAAHATLERRTLAMALAEIREMEAAG